MQKKVAIYVRVSTDDQTVQNQLRDLESVVKNNNWQVVYIFKDEGVSGAKALFRRPEGEKLKRAIDQGEIELLASWSIDRLGRSLKDLIGTLSELESKGIGLYLHQQRIDTTTPAGKAMFQMMGVFAEFERSMIQERVKSGMMRAAASGKVIGRPEISQEKKNRIIELKEQGKGIRKIAAELKTGVGTVIRILENRKNRGIL